MKTNLRGRSTRYWCFIRPKVHFFFKSSFISNTNLLNKIILFKCFH